MSQVGPVMAIRRLLTTIPTMFTMDMELCRQRTSPQSLRVLYSKAFTQKESQRYTRNIKYPAIIRQKLLAVSARSAILGWGRVSPLRRMRWPERFVRQVSKVFNFKRSNAIAVESYPRGTLA